MLLLAALPCAAQKNLEKIFLQGEFIKKAISPQAGSLEKYLHISEVTSAQLGNTLLGRGNDVFPNGSSQIATAKFYHDLEKYIFSQRKSLNGKDIQSLLVSPSLEQKEKLITTYKEIMEKFSEFKKEMDVWLYYQSKAIERHDVSIAEQADILDRIFAMNLELSRLRNYISPNDPAYKEACEYMRYAVQGVNPMFRGLLDAKLFARVDRKYSFQEFFLYTPLEILRRQQEILSNGGNLEQLIFLSFPSSFKIAILNDSEDVLSKMESLHETVLFPEATLHTYKNAEDLLSSIHSGIRYDLILTDLIVPGGGGLYLTAILREENFSGAIIALSAYKEDRTFGRNLFDRGFDGMIEAHIGFEKGEKWPFKLMGQIQNYYYYKNLYDWSR